MNASKQSINVSVVSGWGTNDFDVSVGVVDAGGLVVHVECIACAACLQPFKVGDTVALVVGGGNAESVRAYHLDCLPMEFSFGFLTFARASKA